MVLILRGFLALPPRRSALAAQTHFCPAPAQEQQPARLTWDQPVPDAARHEQRFASAQRHLARATVFELE